MTRHVPQLWAVLVASSILSATGPARAVSSEDWPCVQRKVPELSLASVWTGPSLDEAASQWRSDPDIESLVEHLAARRTSAEEARGIIAKLVASSGDGKREKLLALLAGLFESLNDERSKVMAGIERYGQKQKQLAETVREETTKLDSMRKDASADSSKLTQMNDELTWSLRVFDERQRSLRYVCDVPVLIEQRLFMLTRIIQDALH
jgi:hypothetical protein